MNKIFVVISILFFFLYCSEDNISGFNFEKDTPDWLKVKIDSMSDDLLYSGTKVFRYEYEHEFVYHIMIPIGSCVYCELYYQNGEKVSFINNEEFEDFFNKKKNKIIVWEWESNP